ncbi:MAG: hypothetical protein HQ522_22670 [Bacteroidetes bacterium]|nr:hypothetical protein [Bacteroidota bacterium]
MKNFVLRLITITFLLFIFQTCNEPFDQVSGPLFDSPQGIEIAMEKVQDIIDLQEKAGNVLFRNPQVVGHGVGLDENGKPAIIVFTMEEVKQRKDVNINNIGEGDHPLALPFEIENIPLVLKATGMFKAYADIDPTARFPRPVPIGVSVGHPDITAGTIGCRVTDGSNVYILSNNHVLANSNKALKGDNILQPGTYDGGSEPTDIIGILFDFEEISFSNDNYIDAAIALVNSDSVGVATPDGYFTPGTTTVPANSNLLEVIVKKYGRTTGFTRGTVYAFNATIDVCYKSRGPFGCSQSARFVNQIIITPGDFSDGGDSGSLIVTDDNNNPVALLFAGSSTHTIANPIDSVLNRFNVTIDDGSGGVTPTDLGDIAVTKISAVAYETVDELFNVSVTVSNIGDINISEEIDVSLTDNSSIIKSWIILGGLSPHSSETLTFDWDTSTYGTGTQTLTASQNYLDDNDLNDSNSTDVELGDGSTPPDIILTASGYKIKGVRWVKLEWEGTKEDMDIYQNTILLTNGVKYIPGEKFADVELGKISGTFEFKVCETGTEICSDEAIVVF